MRKTTRGFEEEIFTRAGGTAQQTWDNLQIFVPPVAAEKVAAMFNAVVIGAGCQSFGIPN